MHAMHPARDLFSYRKYWAHRFGPAPFLPTSRAEMDELGWDSCDVIIVTGDAYVDHPSFGMAIVGRVLEAQGFRVGIIAQPDWHSTRDFMKLGRPNLFFGITGGNMDSMVNRYTSDRRIRSDDAYTPHGVAGARPDRCVIVYSQRTREAYKDVPVVIGGIEASLRRIAHFDYWSEKVRRSVLMDAKADLLVFGNAERQICEIAHRLAAGKRIDEIDDLRGTAFARKALPEGWIEIDSTSVDAPGPLEPAGGSVCDVTGTAHGSGGTRRSVRTARRPGVRSSRSPILAWSTAHPISGPPQPPRRRGPRPPPVIASRRAGPRSTKRVSGSDSTEGPSGETRPTALSTWSTSSARCVTKIATAASSACRRTRASPTIRCCTRTPRASSTRNQTQGTRARSFSVTATLTCGSTPRPSRSR
jgi:hypothetical protein